MPTDNLNGKRPVFLLGLGAQKSGTTWLYRYLEGADIFVGGFAKEYHIWDATDILPMRHFIGRRIDILSGGKKAQRYRMQKDTRRYFDYFEGLLRDGAKLTADITPSYSGLGVERLWFIKDEFAKRGVETRAVILIRDPLDRIKSAVRFNLRKKNYNEGIPLGETDFLAALQQYYRTEDCRLRTSYHETIPNALKVFGREHTYIGIYETMFQSSEIARLSEFCGVPERQKMAQVYINKTSGEMAEDHALDAEIIAAYQECYEYCRAFFPETKSLWSYRNGAQ